MPELTTTEQNGQWWIVGPWDEPLGPYRSKADAESDRRGMERTYRHGHKRGFVTMEDRK